MNNKIACPICLKNFITLNSHLHFKHKISTEEFYKQYPGIPLVSEQLKRKVSKKCKKMGCGRLKGCKWSKQTYENYFKRMEGQHGTFYGKKHNEKSKRKMSRNHADFTGDNNPFKNWLKADPKNKEIYSQKRKEFWVRTKANPEKYNKLCKMQSEKMKKYILSGKYAPFSKCKTGWFKSKKFKCKFHFQSSYEEKVLLFCESSNKIKTLKRNFASIQYIGDDKREHYYYPDFLINDKIVIEVKPANMVNYNNNALKIKAGELYCTEHNLVYKLITEKELENLDLVL